MRTRGRRALELPDLRQDAGGCAEEGVGPDRPRGPERGLLVGRVGIGVHEDDGERLRTEGEKALGGRPHLGRVDRGEHRPVRERPLAHLEAQVPLHHGHEVPRQPPCLAAVAPAHFQVVAKAAGGEEPDACALALQERVGPHRGAVHDGRQVRDRAERGQAVEEPFGLVASAGGHLRRLEGSGRLVEQKEVGEGAADVDADDPAPVRHAVCSRLAAAVAASSAVPSTARAT